MRNRPVAPRPGFASLEACATGCGVSAAAVVDRSGDLALEILAGHDPVDEAVLEEKLARLKTLRQFHADRGLDRARAGEADQGPRLGEA